MYHITPRIAIDLAHIITQHIAINITYILTDHIAIGLACIVAPPIAIDLTWNLSYHIAMYRTLWPVPPLPHVKKRRSFSMADSDSTALRDALWPAHLAARPCAPRPSPMAQGGIGLIPSAPPPGQAVGAWYAAGALSHLGARGGKSAHRKVGDMGGIAAGCQPPAPVAR